LLGANGAGKSTTLKAISGLLRVEEGEVTDGSIEWNGERIDKKSAEEIGRLALFRRLKGEECLSISPPKKLIGRCSSA